METAVVILNWNGVTFLQKFLPGLIRNTPDATIIIIDNCSTDNSVSFIKENHPEVEIIQNKENGGFAKGYNDGLQKLAHRFKFYGIINSDIEVTENWLPPLLKKLKSSEQVVAVQPKIRSYHNKKKFEHAGASGGFIDKNFYPFCRGRIFDAVETDSNQYEEEKEIFWATGACMVVRANIFHELGGFDSDFFAHMEEIDFCWRAKKRNYSLFVIPSSTVYHVGGGTLNYENPRKTYLNFRNNLYMIHKNYDGWLLGKILYRMCLDGLAGLNYLLHFKFDHLLAIIKAHFSYYSEMNRLNQKRKKIQKSSTTFNSAGLYNASILWAYYFKKIRIFHHLNKRFFK